MTKPHGRRTERGATAVVVALVLTVMAGFLALVMNVGHLKTVRAQLHNATDSAALAAARELNGTEDGLAAARAMAAAYAAQHQTDSLENDEPRILINPEADVRFGHWWSSRPRATAFEEILGRTPADLNWINAVLVQDGREAARGNEVKTITGLFDRKATDVTAASVAVFGGACETYCAVPIAFSSCIIVDPVTKELNCDSVLEFNSDNTDNIGFTNLADDPSVNMNIVRNLVGNDEECTTATQVDASIGVTNGNSLGSVFDGFSTLRGKTVTAPVVYLGECGPEAKFVAHASTTAPVIGFVSFTIQEVYGPPVNKIILETECQWSGKKAAVGGCNFFGTTSTQPRLVR
jgi:putative Flp pilus-assembly TadE/G-like protein